MLLIVYRAVVVELDVDSFDGLPARAKLFNDETTEGETEDSLVNVGTDVFNSQLFGFALAEFIDVGVVENVHLDDGVDWRFVPQGETVAVVCEYEILETEEFYL